MKNIEYKEVEYLGQKCFIVYVIPILNKDGEKQCIEEMVYLSHPFNYCVPAKIFKPK